jgi:hypothetical protein
MNASTDEKLSHAIETSNQMLFSYINSPNVSDEVRKKLGPKFKDFVFSCIFQNSIICTEEDFEWFHDYYHGSCWKFNHGKLNSGKKFRDNTSGY